MTKYLKTKDGSIEDLAKQMQNKVLESDYQDKFKKALDKEGKPLGHMSGAEKKAFFNKVDKMHKGKDENAMSMPDVDRLKKSEFFRLILSRTSTFCQNRYPLNVFLPLNIRSKANQG